MLQRVLEIYDAQESVEPTAYADALIELGDLYLIFDKWTAAARRYGQAQTRLLEAGGENTEADALFATPEPVVLYLPEARAPSDPTGLEPQLGFVDYRYRVNTRGRAFDMEITDFGPKDVLGFRLKRASRKPASAPSRPGKRWTRLARARHEFSFLGPPRRPRLLPRRMGTTSPAARARPLPKRPRDSGQLHSPQAQSEVSVARSLRDDSKRAPCDPKRGPAAFRPDRGPPKHPRRPGCFCP